MIPGPGARAQGGPSHQQAEVASTSNGAGPRKIGIPAGIGVAIVVNDKRVSQGYGYRATRRKAAFPARRHCCQIASNQKLSTR